MKRKLIRSLAACGISLCMMLAYCPLQAADGSLKSWTEVSSALEAAGKTGGSAVIDLSSMAVAGQPIVIPSTLTDVTIIGNSTKTYTTSISLETRSSALNLTIKDLKIDAGSNSGIDVNANSSDTTIVFSGDNKIVSTSANGIAVYDGASVTLKGKEGDTDKLDITAGPSAAGIGGRYYTGAGAVKKSNGKITINSGTLTVQGGADSAAIGTANDPDSGKLNDITINGGVITATGGCNAAGIGQGKKAGLSPTGTITIAGGTVKATGGSGGAGIGCGIECDTTYNILIKGTIESTVVEAKGNGGGAGIGGGVKCGAQDILIYGGTIDAQGSDSGSTGSAGIGGGAQRGFNKIVIGEKCEKGNNPYIKKVIAGSGAAGIGTGKEGSADADEEIFLNSGIIEEITTTGGAAGIGGGYARGIGKIEVGYTRLEKVCSNGDGGAAIGTGALGARGANSHGNANVIEIKKGSASYVDSGSSTYNCLGGGKDRDTSSIKVNISGDVFMANDKINTGAVLAAGMKKYAFECYEVQADKTRTLMSEGNFSIRNKNDPDMDLKPKTDSNGRIYAIMEDFGSAMYQTKGYFYCYTKGGQTYYADEFERNTVGDTIVVKVQFIVANPAASSIKLDDKGGSKIVPYSYSNIEFVTKIDKGTPAEKPDKISDVKAEVDLKVDSADVAPFELNLSKMSFAVLVEDASGDYKASKELTKELNENKTTYVSISSSKDKIIIKYPKAMYDEAANLALGLSYGEDTPYKSYKIRILVPNKLKNAVKFDTYFKNYVKKSSMKELSVKLTYGASACTKLWGSDFWTTPPTIKTTTESVKALYWYLTKIN